MFLHNIYFYYYPSTFADHTPYFVTLFTDGLKTFPKISKVMFIRVQPGKYHVTQPGKLHVVGSHREIHQQNSGFVTYI